jgi:hypothetical protein
VEFGCWLAWLSPVESRRGYVASCPEPCGVCWRVLVCACICALFLFWGTCSPFSFA